jgi:hypothetical protein
LAAPLLVPLFGASKPNPSKNRERGGALALDGRRSIKLNNNQPKLGGTGRWGVRSEARWASTKIFNIKYTMALNGHRSTILNATTNQKLAAATEGCMEGRFDKREAQGKRNSIVLGALDVELKAKTYIKQLSLVNFFSQPVSQIKQNPHTLPSSYPFRRGSRSCHGDRLHHGGVVCWLVNLKN